MGERVMAAHEREDLKCGHIKAATYIYRNVILPLRITKMPFSHLKLKKFHFGLKMLAQ